MESLSKQELISTITKQADQIKRYEGRLRGIALRTQAVQRAMKRAVIGFFQREIIRDEEIRKKIKITNLKRHLARRTDNC